MVARSRLSYLAAKPVAQHVLFRPELITSCLYACPVQTLLIGTFHFPGHVRRLGCTST